MLDTFNIWGFSFAQTPDGFQKCAFSARALPLSVFAGVHRSFGILALNHHTTGVSAENGSTSVTSSFT